MKYTCLLHKYNNKENEHHNTEIIKPEIPMKTRKTKYLLIKLYFTIHNFNVVETYAPFLFLFILNHLNDELNV